METWNQCVNNCKLTIFIADHSEMFQNRDNNNGKITQMETWNQCLMTGNLQAS